MRKLLLLLLETGFHPFSDMCWRKLNAWEIPRQQPWNRNAYSDHRCCNRFRLFSSIPLYYNAETISLPSCISPFSLAEELPCAHALRDKYLVVGQMLDSRPTHLVLCLRPLDFSSSVWGNTWVKSRANVSIPKHQIFIQELDKTNLISK